MINWNDVREGGTGLGIPDGMTTIRIVGVSFVPAYPDNLLELQKTHAARIEWIPLVMTRNPENPYDSNAIEVRYNGEMLGHIPKDLAAVISPKMASGDIFTAAVFAVLISPENPRNPGLDILITDYE